MVENNFWNIENVNDFIIAAYEYICKKSLYATDISLLSNEEKVFLITQQLELEVNNGGFSQYFYNSSGDYANEVVRAFTEIGAIKTAEICKKALASVGKPLPANRAERVKLLNELDSDKFNEVLEECDDMFYAYEDDLNALNYAYIIKHKAAFM